MTVSDSDGASDTDTVDVTVANVKPTIVLTGSATADEGETNTYSFTVTDPGPGHAHDRPPPAAPTAPRSPGRTPTTRPPAWAASSASFPDGPATTNVTATVTDSDGAVDTDNQVVVVTVANVAPTVDPDR